MDSLYKDALRKMQEDKYDATKELREASAALYPVNWTYLPLGTGKEQKEELTEKKVILESFAQYAQEEISESKDQKIIENNVEIALKVSSQETSYQVEEFNLEDLRAAAVGISDELSTQLRFEGKSRVKLLFISDCLYLTESEKQNEFDTLFQKDISHLFSRMVKAMRLDEKEFFLSAFGISKEGEEDKEAYQEQLLREITFFKPEFIITLGVSPTHRLLKIKDRLKDVHGEFRELQVNQHTIKVMPLFSPNLLGSAPNMKKIAWEDMQKVMTALNL